MVFCPGGVLCEDKLFVLGLFKAREPKIPSPIRTITAIIIIKIKGDLFLGSGGGGFGGEGVCWVRGFTSIWPCCDGKIGVLGVRGSPCSVYSPKKSLIYFYHNLGMTYCQ
jgi:hypothetical protein